MRHGSTWANGHAMSAVDTHFVSTINKCRKGLFIFNLNNFRWANLSTNAITLTFFHIHGYQTHIVISNYWINNNLKFVGLAYSI
jgi:hypothetical protein